MKMINISYIHNNRKIFNKVKLVCIGTAFSLLTSCTVIDKKIENTSQEDKPTSAIVLDVPNIPVKEIVENNIEQLKKGKLQSFRTYKDFLIEKSKQSDVEKLVLKKEQNDMLEDTKDKSTEINISDIKLNGNGVSTYNTDFEIPQNLQTEINGYINSFGTSCSFIAINLNDGMTFGYNIDAAYQTASTIKAAFALYSFKEMDKGNGSLEELKVYEEKFRRDGSGVLQNKESGTKYTLKDLFYYTINYSDNVAYYMVHDRFYSEGYNDFLRELGCNQLYLYNGGKWGFIDARSMALVWQEIYKYKDETENGKYLFELFTNAQYNYIREGMTNYESAHKSGWTPRETHDSAIVFAEDDYIVVTLNNNNGNYSAKSQLLKISGCIEKIIDEYTLYKNQNKPKTLVKEFE